MATLKNLVPGQVVYSVTSERAGNTTTRRQVVRPLTIVSVDHESQTVTIRTVNGQRTVGAREARRWKVNKPERKLDIYDRAVALLSAKKAAGLAYDPYSALREAKVEEKDDE